ncbi:hypothetical protein [Actinophytocola gossypii]|uniref:Uncharacterized protein n=1 Tax=Actinophytocola gossypii TaxID=2812003 RepID=A0ABT2J9M8_9PSEU|nr:hypothetical protein [Actinophytocola gossypii]MCT2584573.1 hypothetical protein [Actinophytocola gossypii]
MNQHAMWTPVLSGTRSRCDREVTRHLLNEFRERRATVLPDTARYAAPRSGEVESSDGDDTAAWQRVDTIRGAHPDRSARSWQPGPVDLPPDLREALLT